MSFARAAIVAVASLALAGCASTASDAPSAQASAGGGTATATPSPVLADACVVRAESGGAGRADAVVAALADAGLRVRATTARGVPEVAAVVDDLVATRCALLLSVDPELADAVMATAAAHRELPIAVAGLGRSATTPVNVVRLDTDATAAAYAAGRSAALVSRTGEVGALGLRSDPDAAGLIEAFAAGVRDGGGAVSARGTDPVRLVPGQKRAERVLRRWADDGVDVAFVASPALRPATPGAISLAWIVPDLSVPARTVARQVADGTFGADVVGTLADGGVRLDLGGLPASGRAQAEALVEAIASAPDPTSGRA